MGQDPDKLMWHTRSIGQFFVRMTVLPVSPLVEPTITLASALATMGDNFRPHRPQSVLS